ncbi:MAG: methyltransferase [Intestinimonas sp.]|jgi:tRNA1(Val) A37 N6-methylase TrmN6|nr:methyltransferase [Intestinimonas sp.]
MARPECLGRYLLRQEDCFPLGADTLDLAAFATLRKGWTVYDLGCGSGALLLLLAQREPGLALCGVERDEKAAQTARGNLKVNGLTGTVYTADVMNCRSLLPAGRGNIVISNPPYFSPARGTSGGPCRAEETCTLPGLCASAAYLLKNGGRFALVYPTERLPELFLSLSAAGLEPKRLRLIQHRRDCPPAAVLVEAVRQGRPGLSIQPVLIRTEPYREQGGI